MFFVKEILFDLDLPRNNFHRKCFKKALKRALIRLGIPYFYLPRVCCKTWALEGTAFDAASRRCQALTPAR